jgi:hypothetical protein
MIGTGIILLLKWKKAEERASSNEVVTTDEHR